MAAIISDLKTQLKNKSRENIQEKRYLAERAKAKAENDVLKSKLKVLEQQNAFYQSEFVSFKNLVEGEMKKVQENQQLFLAAPAAPKKRKRVDVDGDAKDAKDGNDSKEPKEKKAKVAKAPKVAKADEIPLHKDFSFSASTQVDGKEVKVEGHLRTYKIDEKPYMAATDLYKLCGIASKMIPKNIQSRVAESERVKPKNLQGLHAPTGVYLVSVDGALQLIEGLVKKKRDLTSVDINKAMDLLSKEVLPNLDATKVQSFEKSIHEALDKRAKRPAPKPKAPKVKAEKPEAQAPAALVAKEGEVLNVAMVA